MAAAPVHSQKPRCQKTESRSVAQIGFDQAGSSRARSNNASLQKMPANGSRVRGDQIQNRRAAARSCRRAFHAHQQAQIIAKAKQPAAERPSNSCSRRIRKTSWLCCGTTKQAQINATIPRQETYGADEGCSRCDRSQLPPQISCERQHQQPGQRQSAGSKSVMAGIISR